jgi:phage terminase large subunit-like protein
LPALSYGSQEDYDDPKEYADFPEAAFPDPLGRPKDAPLWEAKFNLPFLLKNKQVMQDEFDALYQGVPGTPGGGKFKKSHFRGITEAELAELAVKKGAYCRSWDLAWSSSTDADWTVGLKAALYHITHLTTNTPEGKVHPEDKGLPICFIVIEDVVRYQKEWEHSEPEIKRLALDDGPGVSILVEAVASQNTGFKSLRGSPALWRHAVFPIKPHKDKVARAQYPTRIGGLGMLFILQPNPTTMPEWAEGFLNELADFPHGTKDDQVDALTQIVNYWQPTIDEFLRAVIMGQANTLAVEVQPDFMQRRPFPFQEAPSAFPAQDKHSWGPH